MSSAKRDVDVYDGSRHIERLAKRPVRLMPNNHAGIVYAGQVYPLKVGNRIDLADAPVKKALCTDFVMPSASIPYAPGMGIHAAPSPRAALVDRWHVESNRFGHYLVFDASLAVAKQVVAVMDDVGLGVRRWDESVRESDNGILYDWFIRLKFNGSRDDCVDQIRTAFERGGQVVTEVRAATPEREDPDLAILRLRIENLDVRTEATLQAAKAKLEIDRLTDELASATTLATRLEKQLTDVRDKSKLERTQLRRRLKDLEHQVADLQVSSPVDPETQTRLDQVQAAKDEAEQQYFSAQESAEEWEERAHAFEAALESEKARAAAVQHEVQRYRERLDSVESELNETRLEHKERRSVTSAAGGPPQGSVEAFLSRLLPRTDLDVDSVETLLEWPRPATALGLLRQIDAGDEPRGKKRVVNKAGWWEVPKVNTGRQGKETAGRIYYALAKDKRIFVVLHEKEDGKEQKRFIDLLPDQP